MPRKPKSSVETKPTGNGSAAPESKKKSGATAATAKKKKAAAPKKSPVKPSSAAAPNAAMEPTDEQIRLRAYFLAERRHRLSLPGDSNHDWIEARRQLIEEAQAQRSGL